jgi:hypothetical protein
MPDEIIDTDDTDDEKPTTVKHDDPLSNFFKKNSKVSKSKKEDDELIDIHVGNPLKKITQLLEDIKTQKAFSFTLKGSLGIMGVALVIGSFGIFGGTRAFCEKGIQTKIGSIKTLAYQDVQKDSWVDFIPIINSFFPKKMMNRIILITPDNQVLSIVFAQGIQLISDHQTPTTNHYITGHLDSCSNTLTVDNQNGIQEN